ncbi:unnamed protein product [Ilex paraguariensis]|uniref:Uncharacterized protein n=1 Tax=Ilex paraguariensis TaxID=185542 RepID=A0ABC8SMH7_9AQUA
MNDQRKGPQNMFRPLLSSVPSSTFYVGKASAGHRAIISRNSSVTSSSNASSDQATSGARDTEGSDQNQEDVTSEFVKAQHPDVQDEIFVFDKGDAANEDNGDGIIAGLRSSECDEGLRVDSQPGGSENFTNHDTIMAITVTSEDLDVKSDFEEVDGLRDMLLCFKCGCKYFAKQSLEGDLHLCPDCRRSDVHLDINTSVTAMTVAENSPMVYTKVSEEHESFDSVELPVGAPESPQVTTMGEPRDGPEEKFSKTDQKSYSEASWNSLSENDLAQPSVEEVEQRLANQQVMGQLTVGNSIPDGDARVQHIRLFSDHPNLKVGVAEGAGIAVVLKRSYSGKRTNVQSRSFSASSISYDDLSYVRDSANSMMSSVGLGSMSASSSVDLGSARQTETPVKWQLSGRKSEKENYRYDVNTKHQRTGSSLSGTPSHALNALGLATSTHEGSTEASNGDSC